MIAGGGSVRIGLRSLGRWIRVAAFQRLIDEVFVEVEVRQLASTVNDTDLAGTGSETDANPREGCGRQFGEDYRQSRRHQLRFVTAQCDQLLKESHVVGEIVAGNVVATGNSEATDIADLLGRRQHGIDHQRQDLSGHRVRLRDATIREQRDHGQIENVGPFDRGLAE